MTSDKSLILLVNDKQEIIVNFSWNFLLRCSYERYSFYRILTSIHNLWIEIQIHIPKCFWEFRFIFPNAFGFRSIFLNAFVKTLIFSESILPSFNIVYTNSNNSVCVCVQNCSKLFTLYLLLCSEC